MELFGARGRRRRSASRGDDDVEEEEEVSLSDDDDDDDEIDIDEIDVDEDSDNDDDGEIDIGGDWADGLRRGGGGPQAGYCSFVQAMPGGSRASKGEKFSYLVAHKRARPAPAPSSPDSENPFDGSSVTELLDRTYRATFVSEGEHARALRDAADLEDRYLDSDLDPLGLELVSGDRNRGKFGRIVRAPIKRKGHVWIDCCCPGPAAAKEQGGGGGAPDGRIVRHGVRKSASQVAPGIYAAARKSRWGGYWPNAEATAERSTGSASGRADE
jgi:hypothetical protein